MVTQGRARKHATSYSDCRASCDDNEQCDGFDYKFSEKRPGKVNCILKKGDTILNSKMQWTTPGKDWLHSHKCQKIDLKFPIINNAQ